MNADRSFDLHNMMPTCNRKHYRVDRKEISFLKFILEGYDGMALMTTIDAQTGTVALVIAPLCEPVVDAIVADLAQHILIEPIDENP